MGRDKFATPQLTAQIPLTPGECISIIELLNFNNMDITYMLRLHTAQAIACRCFQKIKTCEISSRLRVGCEVEARFDEIFMASEIRRQTDPAFFRNNKPCFTFSRTFHMQCERGE